MYQTIARDWYNENVDLRHFSSPISVRNLGNDVPDEAVDALLSVARKNTKIFQRYFKLKAKQLGTEKLRRYDIYAPLTASDKERVIGTVTLGSVDKGAIQEAENACMCT